jgi:hypothetical protein
VENVKTCFSVPFKYKLHNHFFSVAKEKCFFLLSKTTFSFTEFNQLWQIKQLCSTEFEKQKSKLVHKLTLKAQPNRTKITEGETEIFTDNVLITLTR